MYGEYLILAGVLIALSTVKRPVFLGGQKRRISSDDTAVAMLNRASVRSLGGYLIFGGTMMWLVVF